MIHVKVIQDSFFGPSPGKIFKYHHHPTPSTQQNYPPPQGKNRYAMYSIVLYKNLDHWESNLYMTCTNLILNNLKFCKGQYPIPSQSSRPPRPCIYMASHIIYPVFLQCLWTTQKRMNVENPPSCPVDLRSSWPLMERPRPESVDSSSTGLITSTPSVLIQEYARASTILVWDHAKPKWHLLENISIKLQTAHRYKKDIPCVLS